MDLLNRPPPLDFTGNVAENWRLFEQDFDVFVSAAHPKADKKTRSYILLNLAGREAIQRSKGFQYADGESSEDPDVLKQKFAELCKPKTNLTIQRHKFNTRNQGTNESFNAYLSDLKIKAASCMFGDLKNDLMVDRIVCGIQSDTVRKLLLRTEDLTLDKAVKICQIHELSETRVQELQKEKTEKSATVDAMGSTSSGRKSGNFRGRGQLPAKSNTGSSRGTPQSKSQTPAAPDTRDTRAPICSNCGLQHHHTDRCPATGQSCFYCGKLNHWDSVCRSKPRGQSRRRKQFQKFPNRQRGKSGTPRQVHTLQPDEEYFVLDSFEVHHVDREEHEAYGILSVGSTNLKLKLDTGAHTNVLPKSSLVDINCEINTNDSVQLKTYSGHTIQTIGSTTLSCLRDNVEYPVKFHIVQESVKPVLGLNDCLRLNFVHLSVDHVTQPNSDSLSHADILKDYQDLFSGKLGTLPVVYKMKLSPDCDPVIRSPRKIPLAVEPLVLNKLANMEKLKVITPVIEPTDWVSSMVAVKKKDKDDIRICIDPRDLNVALQREHYPMRTIEEVLKHIPNAKYFTVLDASNAYWQIQLDEASSYLTTFSTPYGRYRFLRMPFGLKSAAEVFQKAMDHLFKDYPCQNVVDDMLIWGATESEHDAKLIKVLNRAREIGLQLKSDKCKFKVQEVKYVGHILSHEGLKPDPEKTRAITDMPVPTDSQSLHRYLGMITYLAKFIPRLSEIATPLRQLIKQDSVWHWDKQHQKAFEAINDAISNPPLLKYYDPSKPLKLSCDASKSGLGAALLQDDIPIAYASKALTPTQSNYAQIEKELLAVLFGCQKFDDYVYGHHVYVETDHKPLEVIMKKPLFSTPVRLQRMLLQLQRYDIDVHYHPGKELTIADTLSRAHLKDNFDVNTDFEILTITHFSSESVQKVKQATQDDGNMQKLVSYIRNGWPRTSSGMPADLKHFHAFRDELVIDNGIILKGLKTVVPQSLTQDYVKQLHKGHLGAESTKRLAREFLYWHGMAMDIDSYVNSCTTCNSLKPHQPKEPLLLHEIPTRPFQITATDLFEWNNMTYIVLVDSYSGFYELSSLSSTTSHAVISKLKSYFARHGVPNVLFSDNGPQYSSKDFTDFAKEWNFCHRTSSPNYPQSNGLAENAVKAAKTLLEKCKLDNSDPHLALLHVRNTPRDVMLGSQVQRLMSRRTRTPLPISAHLLMPDVKNPKSVTRRLKELRMQQKAYFDRSAHSLSKLEKSDVVRLQTPKGHQIPATVRRCSDEPRSYVVTANNREYRRNRRHLLKVSEPEGVDQSDDDLASYDIDLDRPPARPVRNRRPPQYLEDYVRD